MTWWIDCKKFSVLNPFQKTRRSRRRYIMWSRAIKVWQPLASFSVGNTTLKSQHLYTEHHREEWSRRRRTTANSKWSLRHFPAKVLLQLSELYISTSSVQTDVA